MKEKWDLYDSSRKPAGLTAYRGDFIPSGLFHMAVHLCLFNHQGLLLCQKRSLTVSSFPFHWDVTAGGCALAGESSLMAVQRELKEELGISTFLTEADLAFTVTAGNCFDDYYLKIADIDTSLLHLNNEVCAVSYFSIEEVLSMAEDDLFIPYAHLERIADFHRQHFGQ